MTKNKETAVLFGAGSIGLAIIHRIGVGKHIVLADYSEKNAQSAAKLLEDAGYECNTIKADLGNKADILAVVEEAKKWGNIKNVVNAAGVSPSQALVEEIESNPLIEERQCVLNKKYSLPFLLFSF